MELFSLPLTAVLEALDELFSDVAVYPLRRWVLSVSESAISTIGIKRLFDNIALRANASKLDRNVARKV